jgi:hypothetical protein
MNVKNFMNLRTVFGGWIMPAEKEICSSDD